MTEKSNTTENKTEDRPKHLHNISIDFDGVIHEFKSPWTKSLDIHDPPVDGSFDFIRNAINSGFGIQIHSARSNDISVQQAMIDWFLKHGLEFYYVDRLNISPIKKGAIIYIDDRGFRFEGKFPTLDEIRLMKQWNK